MEDKLHQHSFLKENYKEARAKYLTQVAYMNQKNLNDAERYGGVQYLRQNDKAEGASRFLGIERRLIELAAYDDATLAYIEALETVLFSQFETIMSLEAKVRKLEREPMARIEVLDQRSFLSLMVLGAPVPRRIAAHLDQREARRHATVVNAKSSQPHLY